MRRFYSYGPVDVDENYYAPRKELIEKTYTQLTGYDPQKGGHYFTVWAPHQTGKTWIMQQILMRLKKDPRFHVLKINLEILKEEKNVSNVIGTIAEYIGEGLNMNFTGIKSPKQFQEIFKNTGIEKPVILILDEFDAIVEKGINAVVGAFRNIYIHRRDESDKTTGEKTYLLHGVALIGVRSVLGIDNEKGSLPVRSTGRNGSRGHPPISHRERQDRFDTEIPGKNLCAGVKEFQEYVHV